MERDYVVDEFDELYEEEDEEMDEEIYFIVAAREMGKLHKKGCNGLVIVDKFTRDEFSEAREKAEEYCRKNGTPCRVYALAGEAKPQKPPVIWEQHDFSPGA